MPHLESMVMGDSGDFTIVIGGNPYTLDKATAQSFVVRNSISQTQTNFQNWIDANLPPEIQAQIHIYSLVPLAVAITTADGGAPAIGSTWWQPKV